MALFGENMQMSTERPEGDIEVDAEKKDSGSGGLKLYAFGWAILRWWGILFRALFISALGITGYFWLDPKSIGDVPFAELTLNHIFNNLFAVLIPIGCIYWLFNFPDQRNSKDPDSNPYVSWGRFGGLVVLIAVLIINWLNKK